MTRVTTAPRDHPTPTRAGAEASARELAVAALGLLLLFASQLGLAQSFGLFTRHFWMDEIFTQTLVADASLGHLLQALSAGVETHPPALYLLLRGYTRLLGSTSELALRSFAALAVGFALVGIYGCLRRSFERMASALAVLALGCHPYLINQAFNARFYGVWLAAAVWCAYLLVRLREPGRPATWLALAACAAVLCTVHYFGVVSLALLVGGELLARRWAGQPVQAGMVAVAAGPVALAACLPMLRSQSAGLPAGTWMDPTSVAVAVGLVRDYVRGLPTGWLVVAAWLSLLAAPGPRIPNRGSLYGLTGLLLLPVLVLTFSFTVLPTHEPRYSFPAIAGLAPPLAWVAARCNRGWGLALGGLLFVLGTVTMRGYAQVIDSQEVLPVQRLIHDLRDRPDGAPLVFESPAQLFVVYHYAADLRARSRLLDFDQGEIGNVPSNRLFMRDLARHYADFYPEPPLARWAEVRRLSRFYLIPADFGAAGAPMVVDDFYPGFHVRPVAPQLYELTATGGR